jgi:hypothetical protein
LVSKFIFEPETAKKLEKAGWGKQVYYKNYQIDRFLPNRKDGLGGECVGKKHN